MKHRPGWLTIVSAAAGVFGVLTVVAGGRVLFCSAKKKKKVGNYVEAIVWFNFLAGFAYVVTAVFLAQGRRIAAWLSGGLALATAVAFACFGIWVLRGGAFEGRTIAAMSVRMLFWTAVAVAGFRASDERRVRPAEAS